MASSHTPLLSPRKSRAPEDERRAMLFIRRLFYFYRSLPQPSKSFPPCRFSRGQQNIDNFYAGRRRRICQLPRDMTGYASLRQLFGARRRRRRRLFLIGADD